MKPMQLPVFLKTLKEVNACYERHGRCRWIRV
jgi:hypothetical protein